MKTIAAALALALLGSAAPSAAPSPAVANYDALGFALLGKLAPAAGNKNVFISPLSIGVALSMAADGAGGSTRSGILKVAGVQGDVAAANAALIAELKTNPDAKVGIANALWLRNDLPPRPQYVSHLATSYGAGSQALKFGDPSAAAAINAWTKAHTFDLIDRLVDETHSNDLLYLTNAVAFHGDWSAPFEKGATHPADFTDADGAKHKVQMMSHSAGFAIGAGSGFRALRLPYGGGGFAAYVLLPDGSDVDALVSTLTPASFAKLTASLQNEQVAVSLPRFTATYHTSLNATLRSLGMDEAFSKHADFSGIRSGPPRFAISDVEHASYLRVDEQGTTAAAATSIGMATLAMRMPAATFVVDRPFVFAIRDERAGALLFVGAIKTLPSA